MRKKFKITSKMDVFGVSDYYYNIINYLHSI